MNLTDLYRQLQPAPWMVDAACRGSDPELFFPERGDQISDKSDAAQARKVCATCSVTVECLAHGMKEKQGIWGGLSESERRQLRRRLSAEDRIAVGLGTVGRKTA